MSKDPRSHWDTPADGDFASYVERLSAAPVPAPAPLPAAAASDIDPSDLTPEEAVSTAGLAEKVRSVRLVFLLVLVGQVLLLWFFRKGSLPLLFFTGIIWVVLGRGQSALFLAWPASNGGNSGDAAKNSNLQRLREQLQRSVRERATKQKK